MREILGACGWRKSPSMIVLLRNDYPASSTRPYPSCARRSAAGLERWHSSQADLSGAAPI